MVEMKGFKKTLQDNIEVQINATRTVDITMAVGVPEETVTVTQEQPPLNVSDPNIGQTIDRKRVDELPSVHGDPYYLINLTPGVAYTGSTRLDRPFEPTHIANFAMGGARGIRSDLLIDGAPSTATANANEVIASYVPTTDATQEFKVQTATYDAQFGNTEGGVTSIVYNGKNNTFFFFSFEQIDDSRPRFDANNIWSPTDALKNGDFSAYASSIKIYDPRTGTYNTSTGVVTNRTQFTNNIIPPDRINPVAKAVLAFMGSPKHGRPSRPG